MDMLRINYRLFRKAVQQGRSKRRGEAYLLWYVEPLSAARTPLARCGRRGLRGISLEGL